MQETAQSGSPGHPATTARLVVAGILVRANQGANQSPNEVLICQRRADQAMALKWEFPGGKVELGESAEQALRRELEEELGITAEIGNRVAHILHTYRNGGVLDLQFFLVPNFRGELTNRVFKDFQWCPINELARHDFLEADRPIIRDLAAGKLFPLPEKP